MNRHHRRELAARTGKPMLPSSDLSTQTKYSGPTPKIRLLLIEPTVREVRQVIMPMHPDEFRKLLGKQQFSWAKLGSIDARIDIMLAGDPSEQPYGPEHRWFEPEYEVSDTDGAIGPLLHGKSAVFGFAPQLGRAASVPVGPEWLEERIMWREPPKST